MIINEKVINFLRSYTGYLVLDPIMISTSGKNLFEADFKNYLSQIKNIFPFIDIITPNIPEAEKILNCNLKSYQDIEKVVGVVVDTLKARLALNYYTS